MCSFDILTVFIISDNISLMEKFSLIIFSDQFHCCSFWILLMNREQNRSQIILISAKAFDKDDESVAPIILWEEHSPSWINVSLVICRVCICIHTLSQ